MMLFVYRSYRVIMRTDQPLVLSHFNSVVGEVNTISDPVPKRQFRCDSLCACSGFSVDTAFTL